MPLRAVEGHLLAWCQVGVTVVLEACGSKTRAAKCSLGHVLLPPQALSRTTSPTVRSRTRFPASGHSNRGKPADLTKSGLAAEPWLPLAAGCQHIAQRLGLVGHDSVDALVEEAGHDGGIVDGPGVHLQADCVRMGDEPRSGHGERDLRALD